jgi:hypothetical protein
MDRTLLALVLSVSLLVCGCATQQAMIPRGQDPDELAEAIARNAQATRPVDPASAGTSALGDCVKVAGKVLASAGVVALVLLYGIAGGEPGASPAAANPKSPEATGDASYSNVLRDIWDK